MTYIHETGVRSFTQEVAFSFIKVGNLHFDLGSDRSPSPPSSEKDPSFWITCTAPFDQLLHWFSLIF